MPGKKLTIADKLFKIKVPYNFLAFENEINIIILYLATTVIDSLLTIFVNYKKIIN